MCEAVTDFHVPNEDEDDHGQSTMAMEAMLEDRDETYKNFIELEYGYTLTEKKARNGYMVHGTQGKTLRLNGLWFLLPRLREKPWVRTEFLGMKPWVRTEISEHEAMEQDEILEYEDLEEQFEMQGNLDHGTMPEITEKKTGFSYPYGLVNETDLEERRQITWLKFAEDIDEEKEGTRMKKMKMKKRQNSTFM